MIGLHVKRSSDTLDDIKKLQKCCNVHCIQFFLESPKKRRTGKLSDEVIKISQWCNENKITVFIHAAYVFNIAKTITNKRSEKLDWWNLSLVKEIKMTNQINAKSLILHVGKSMELEEKQAVYNMYDTLEIMIKYLSHTNIELLLETPAGQGTELLYDFDKFLDFYKNLSDTMKKKIFICIDTCHLFASGTDMRTKENIDNVIEKIKKTVGVKAIHLIHLNDSEYPLSSRRDRHLPIGEGEIGLTGLKYMCQWAVANHIPVILETNSKNPKEELKSLIT